MALKPKVTGRILEVLYVEDNMGDVTLLKKVVKQAGFPMHLTAVGDGEEAFQFLKREGRYVQSLKPDVVLLDLNLPQKDGMTILVEMRQNPEWKNLPVIILTNSESDLDRDWANRLQASHFVVKPEDLGHYGDLVKYLKEFWMKSFKVHRPSST